MIDDEARDEILRLKLKHGLTFRHNPGGGEFNGPKGFRCQIYLHDDVEDLAKLRTALRAAGLDEPPGPPDPPRPNVPKMWA